MFYINVDNIMKKGSLKKIWINKSYNQYIVIKIRSSYFLQHVLREIFWKSILLHGKYLNIQSAFETKLA